MIWFTSDFHFWHDKDFIYQPRGCSTIEEMNEEIIRKHNSVVKKDDTVYVLGDCGLGLDTQAIIDCLKQLNGELILIVGNHDTNNRISEYKKSGVFKEIKYGDRIRYRKKDYFISHCPYLTGDLNSLPKDRKKCTYNIHGHLHSPKHFHDELPFSCFQVSMESNMNYPISIETIDFYFQENKETNKKKMFVVSDVHSFYTIFKKALDKAGFDPSDESHWLIVLGDLFDRGNESEKLLQFIMSLERKVLIRGNHETLLEECCLREMFDSIDIKNGTAKTIQQLSSSNCGANTNAFQYVYKKLEPYRNLLVNYFETENYIFVHSWIPKGEDWRNATQEEWDNATWGNPFLAYIEQLNNTGKTIVFGHWQCSTGHLMATGKMALELELEEDGIWEPFYGDKVIAIDRLTTYTGKCNVIVLEDKFLE